MECPGIEQLEDWLSGRAAPEEVAALEAHLGQCLACRDRLAEVRPNLEFATRLARFSADSGDGTTPSAAPDSAAAAAPLQPDLGIRGYEIVGELGRGGMGVVYEAIQQNPRRRVALKVFESTDLRRLQLFQREAQALAMLKHSNIATIYEAGRSERGAHYFAMELVEGLPLNAYVRNVNPSREQRLRIFKQICDAVEYAHIAGVLHRDLKPANIIVEPGSARSGADFATFVGGDASSRFEAPNVQPKILDFGLARITGLDAAASQSTQIGTIQGTLPYMSPEQARGDPAQIDERSDIYSLGVVLYELLTGSLPHNLIGVGLPEAVRIICEASARPPSATVPSLSGDLDTIVLRALSKDAAGRYASARALADDVDRFLSGTPIEATPALGVDHRWARGPLLPMAAAVGVVLIAGVLIGRSAWSRDVGTDLPAATPPPATASCDPISRILERRGLGGADQVESLLARIESWKKGRSPPAREAALVQCDAAYLLYSRGDTAGAERIYGRGRRGLDHPLKNFESVDARVAYAQFLADRARIAEARREFATAVSEAGRVGQPDRDAAEAVAHAGFGRFLLNQSEFDEAEQHLLAAWERVTAGSDPALRDCVRASLFALYNSTDRSEDAARFRDPS